MLSSSWRIGSSVGRINEHFQENGVISPIIDFTPYISDKQENGSCIAAERSAEIKQWLEKHPEVTHFVVIDDDWGLDERQANKAIKILK